MSKSINARAGKPRSSLPPLRSINAAAATGLPPACSTTAIVSRVDPPVVHTSSTTSTRSPGLNANPLLSAIRPEESLSTNIARTPSPRATSCPTSTPPNAGEATQSTAMSRNFAASSLPSRSAMSGYCNTSAHCTYIALCLPLDSSKCPCLTAPTRSNTCCRLSPPAALAAPGRSSLVISLISLRPTQSQRAVSLGQPEVIVNLALLCYSFQSLLRLFDTEGLLSDFGHSGNPNLRLFL